MLIILDGVDGGGKSTLAEEISDILRRRYPDDKVEIWKKGPPTQHPLEEYETPLLDYKPNTGHHLILDRWHVGEWVYPAILKRDSLADLATWRHIEMFLEVKGAVLVHVTSHHETLTRRLVERGDDLIEPHMTRAIVSAYHDRMSYTRLPVLVYTRHDHMHLTVQQVIGKARLTELSYAQLNRFTTLIGNRKPNILFFGDVRNRVDEIDPRRPVFMPYRDTSGHFLLSRATSLFRGAALANACDVDDPVEVWRQLDRPQVVAFGRNAWNCTKNITDTIGIPHPQYIRRFHNSHGEKWIEAIRQGLIKKEDKITWRP